MSVQRLRRLIESAPALGDDGEWLAAAFGRYVNEAPNGLTLDQVLGVATPLGSRPWWEKQERENQRDAVRILAGQCPPSVRSPASTIAESPRRYQRGRWRIDRDRDEHAGFDQKHTAMRTLLIANRGDAPSPKTIKRLLIEVDTMSPRSCPVTRGQIDIEVTDDDESPD